MADFMDKVLSNSAEDNKKEQLTDSKFFIGISVGLCITYLIFVLVFSFFWVQFSWSYLNKVMLGIC